MTAILIIGEAYGEHEKRERMPFVGLDKETIMEWEKLERKRRIDGRYVS